MEETNHPNKVALQLGVDAIYSDQILPEFRGNPLIEALPPILTEDEVINHCAEFPKYDERERKLDPSYRYHCVQRLFQYFQPFEKHFDLEQRISRSIRQGYVSRNPLNTHQVKRLRESYQGIKEGKFLDNYQTPIKQTALGFTMIGLSGIGKSSALNQILSFYPQLIRHTQYNGEIFQLIQIPWLKLDCPYDGSIKGLCISFFSELDRLIGTSYFEKYKARANIVDVLLQRMVHLANLHVIGVLIIDEIQHLSLSKSGGSEKMLNFFVTLVNTIGVPVILVGTNKAISILQSEFRQARRGSGQGDMVWNQMPKDETWDLFVDGMWGYQWTANFTPLSSDLKEVLYEESQGIIDIAVKLFMISQLRAISAGEEKITKQIIKQVAKENLQLVRPMLNALKNGNQSALAQYDDIRPIDMDEQFYKYKPSIELNDKVRMQKMIQEGKRQAKENSLLQELVLFLLSIDTANDLSHRIAQKVIQQHGDTMDLPSAKKEAMKIIFMEEEKKEEKKFRPKKQATVSTNILSSIASDAKKKKLSVYEHFANHEFIKGKLEDTEEGDFYDL